MTRTPPGLLEEWAQWQPSSPPFVLDADMKWLASARCARSVLITHTWEQSVSADDFGAPGDTRLHLGVLPQPFFGVLRRASIFILLLNPGVGPSDYYGEHKVPEFRSAMLRNLTQQFAPSEVPFLFLDPRFSWHGGFEWWHSKFAHIIGRLAHAWEVSYSQARYRLAQTLASIELLPYHSAIFSDPDHLLTNLPSVRLARDF